MFSYIEGKVVYKDSELLVIENKGIGYNIYTSAKTLNAIECLATYKRKGLVKYDTFYFADRLSNNRDGNGTGTGGFPFVMEDIRNSKCKNAIIVTDDDIERQTRWESDFRTTKIELLGCVWWLWPSETDRSHTAFKRLVGKRGVFQYIL